MDHMPFIIGAYAIATLALGGLALQSWRRMRRAERED
jgi:heme exporter protein CcmD